MASALRTDTAQEEFLALLCADEDLLRAEFEAIIDANWDRPVPQRPVPATPPDRPGRGSWAVSPTTLPGPAWREYGRVWPRVRSPPPAATAQIASLSVKGR